MTKIALKPVTVAFAAVVLFMAFSGFDCASTQMTTAKLALKNKEYDKAITALQEEVAQRPQNGGAWKLMGDIYYEQGSYLPMKDAFKKGMEATVPALTPQEVIECHAKTYNAWLTKYNAAGEAHANQKYKEGLAELDTAMMIGSEHSDNYYLQGLLYEGLQDEKKTNDAYRKYYNAIAPELEKGLSLGLALKMSPDAVHEKLGKPDNSAIDDNGRGYDAYNSQGNLYVYYVNGKSGGAEVVGWNSFNADYPEQLRRATVSIYSYPIYLLGFEAYTASDANKAKYDEALKYLEQVRALDPQMKGPEEIIADIYIKTGRVSEAKKALEKQIEANPNNAKLYISYASLLEKAKEYKNASDNLRKVIEMGLKEDNNDLHVALFNIGAINKNWGSHIQDSIYTAMKDKPTPAQIEEFRAPLRESAKYFEQLYKIKGEDVDYIVLSELGNLYDVLQDQTKLTQAVKNLEGLQGRGDVMGNPRYWRALSRLQAIVGNTKKSSEADKKAQELGG